MVQDSSSATSFSTTLSAMHAVSHPDPMPTASPGVDDPRTYAADLPESYVPTSTSQVYLPAVSEKDGANGGIPASSVRSSARLLQSPGSHLDHLSTIAAAQDKMTPGNSSDGREYPAGSGTNGGPFKRTADGEVKHQRDSESPVRGHSRNTSTMSAVSTVSMASTTASTIGDLSSDLKTRLSYAMLKVQNGWQSNSLDEVESMASQAASPTSSNSTIHRHNDVSASPCIPVPSVAVQYPRSSSLEETQRRPKSKSPPPTHSMNVPGLAPPASIRPSTGNNPNKRRYSNARNTPKLNTLGHAMSPHTPAQSSPLLASHLRPHERLPHSPHQNVREQDAIETLLFMSSPGNSANMKHTFSPTGSPGPSTATQSQGSQRHALPSGPRKALPIQRPTHADKKVGFINSPLTSQPQSPMDFDTPHASPNRTVGASRRRVNGASSHLRGALSLPSGLGSSSNASPRRTIDDAYVETMLEQAAAESSDEEDIQLPPQRSAETFA